MKRANGPGRSAPLRPASISLVARWLTRRRTGFGCTSLTAPPCSHQCFSHRSIGRPQGRADRASAAAAGREMA